MALDAMAYDHDTMFAIFEELWHPDVAFRDPFSRCRGRDAFQKHVGAMTRYGRVCAVIVENAHLRGQVGEAQGMLRFRCDDPVFSFYICFRTRMEFNEEGRIVRHEDNWDWRRSLCVNLKRLRRRP